LKFILVIIGERISHKQRLSAVGPSYEAHGEVTGVGEIRISKSVLECELDGLGIGSVAGGVRW